MNALLAAMSEDMGVLQYYNESEESFTYRLCYSAMGQWCLTTARNTKKGKSGTTKHNQTIVLNELLSRYTELFPAIAHRFADANNQRISFAVAVRRTYEETGYLLTDSKNHNGLANYGRTISVGEKALFFGLPSEHHEVNGLGVLAKSTDYKVCLNDFLIRDNLSVDEYFKTRFDPIDFFERDIDLTELEFFNPKSSNVPSKSWGRKPETDCTIARKSDAGLFYRIMKIDGIAQFADEPVEQQTDSFTSYEYRRLNFALKYHYGTPLKATIYRLDDSYSKIRIGGYLPNREYYLLLLLAWPENNAFDKTNFIIRNELLTIAKTMLANIGIEIKGGQANAKS